jgi:hypothetical protein
LPLLNLSIGGGIDFTLVYDPQSPKAQQGTRASDHDRSFFYGAIGIQGYVGQKSLRFIFLHVNVSMSHTQKVLVSVVILVALGGLTFVCLNRDTPPVPSQKKADTEPEGRRTAEMIKRSAFSEAEAAKPQAPVSQSVFQEGQWARESELKAQGHSTPTAAYESFLRAATGGDVKGTAAAIFLTEDARKRADRLLATIPQEKRIEYATAEELIASLFIGSSAIMGGRTGEISYKFVTDELGIGITPLALGLDESVGSNSAYHTIRSKARSSSGKESDPIAVFYQTNGGWKWVIPPSMIDAFGQLLKNGPAQPSSKK